MSADSSAPLPPEAMDVTPVTPPVAEALRSQPTGFEFDDDLTRPVDVPVFRKSDAPPGRELKSTRSSAPPASVKSTVDDLEPLDSMDSLEDTGAMLVSPAARVRRARFARFVKITLAVSAALCLFAVFRGVLSRRATPAPAPASIEVKPAASPAHVENIEPPHPAPVLDFDAAIAATPEGAKREALVALEAHRLSEAIAAGEQAVALDGTDGEAWLILGAAYQENYQLNEARRCYRTCTTQGRIDPRGECAAMLR